MIRHKNIVIGLILLLTVFIPLVTVQSQDCGEHIVASGENLFRIAQTYGTTVEAIAALNNIPDPSQIFAGQRLVIPCNPTSISNAPFVYPPLVPITGSTAQQVAGLFTRAFDTYVADLSIVPDDPPGYGTAVFLQDEGVAVIPLISPDAPSNTIFADADYRIYDIASSTDGKLAVGEVQSGTPNMFARVYHNLAELNDPQAVPVMIEPNEGFQHIALSPTMLAAYNNFELGVEPTANDMGVHLWDVASGTQAAFLPDDGIVAGAVFSPDSTLLASAGSDNMVTIWDLTTPPFSPVATLDGGVGSISISSGNDTLVFSPDGSTLAVGGWDGSVRFWDLSNGQMAMQLQVITPEQGAVLSIAYSPDGSLLAVSGGFNPNMEGGPLPGQIQDTNIYLYDVSRPARAFEMLQAVLPGSTGAVTGLAFSPDGRLLTSISTDTVMRIWGVLDQTASVQPQPVGPSVISFTADSAFIPFGGSVTLSWSVQNAGGIVITRQNYEASVDIPVTEDSRAQGTFTYTVSDEGARTAGSMTFYLSVLDSSGNPGLPQVLTVGVTPPCSRTFFFGEANECADAAAIEIQGAYQSFEGGFMLWRGDYRQIMVFYPDGLVEVYQDT